MKYVMKIVALLLAASCLPLAAACARDTGGEAIDENRTQLYVSNFNGGVGTEWLYGVKERFEEAYRNEVFEPGTDKVGVQVIIEKTKDRGGTLTGTIANSPYAVFFSESVPYYEWVRNGLVLDISDLVEDTSAGASIESRLSKETKELLTFIDGNYYAIPHYEGFNGVQYDIDLFEENGFYFAKSGNPDNFGFVSADDAVRSCGPDGKYGTSDDGLPATYDEFFTLCSYMLTKNVTPFVWTGESTEYTNYLLEALCARYGEAYETALRYTFDSNGQEVEVITGFDGDTPIVDHVTVTEETGYYIYQQASRYYALQFFQRLMGNSRYYSELSTSPTFSHLDAQDEYFMSKLENQPIAMLIDGNYWWNEADENGVFTRAASYGAAAENRRFGWMPLPGVVSGTFEDVNEENGAKATLVESLRSYAAINANIADDPNMVRLAKLFLQFVYSDEELRTFTASTGVTRNLNYDLGSTELAQLTPYARSFWEYRKQADIVRSSSTSLLFMANENDFTTVSGVWGSTIGGVPYRFPYTAFREGRSAKEYFQGMWVTQADWDAKYRQYYTVSD